MKNNLNMTRIVYLIKVYLCVDLSLLDHLLDLGVGVLLQLLQLLQGYRFQRQQLGLHMKTIGSEK